MSCRRTYIRLVLFFRTVGHFPIPRGDWSHPLEPAGVADRGPRRKILEVENVTDQVAHMDSMAVAPTMISKDDIKHSSYIIINYPWGIY